MVSAPQSDRAWPSVQAGVCEVLCPDTSSAARDDRTAGADSIGADALRGCYSLEEITLPSTITKITARAFYNDRSLKYLDIPSAVTELGASFVANCYSLEYIKFNSSTPPTPAGTAFNDLPTSCVIKVPAGSLSTYTATQYYPSSATYVYEEY